MSRTITHEDAQNAIDHFNFEQEARDYYNSDRFAKKHGVVKPISSYNDLSEVPEHLALAAMQHAACQKQALLFQKLGVKYNITIFEVLSKDNSNDTDSQSSSNGAATTTSSSHGSSDTITEAEATVDSVRHVTQINSKLSKLHHKARQPDQLP